MGETKEIIDWIEKFRSLKGKEPHFEKGDVIRIKGMYHEEDDYSFIRADEGPRSSDSFFFENRIDELADYKGFPLEAIIEVTGESDKHTRYSYCFQYDAIFQEVVSTPLINPTNDEIDNLPLKSRVIFDGIFKQSGTSAADRFLSGLDVPLGSEIYGFSSTGGKTEYSIRLPDGETVKRIAVDKPGATHKSNYGIILLSDGREMRIELPFGRMRYTEAIIPNAKEQIPYEGDHIRIAPMKFIEGLSMVGNEPCVLKMPSIDRLREYVSNVNQMLENHYESAQKLMGYASSKKVI